MRLIVAFWTLYLLSVGAALAKCPFANYRVEGKLLLPPGVQPQELRVYLFLEGTTRTTEYPRAIDGADFTVPTASGSFHADSWLSTITDSSRLKGEKCDRVETGGDLFIVGRGIYAHRTKVKFEKSARDIRRTLRASSKLTPISLEPDEETSAHSDQ